MGRTMSSISFGESGSVLRGTSRPLTRRSGGRPGFRWRSEASFFVTNFRSSVRSIWMSTLGSFYFNSGGRAPGSGRGRRSQARAARGPRISEDARARSKDLLAVLGTIGDLYAVEEQAREQKLDGAGRWAL